MKEFSNFIFSFIIKINGSGKVILAKSFSYISDNISIESLPFLSILSSLIKNMANPPFIKYLKIF